MGFARLDHFICRVPDIHAAHRDLTERLGFAEAWPVGPFWPGALTSGVALGGANLELLQPLQNPPPETYADTLVFEPTSLDEAAGALDEAGVPTRRFEKVEPDPDLLRLRGFKETSKPQRICENLLPEGSAPLDFFLCDYVPFLKDRLSPARHPAPYGEIAGFDVRVPDPDAARAFLAKVGYRGAPFTFAAAPAPRIERVRFASGKGLWILASGFEVR